MFHTMNPNDLTQNVFSMIGEQWMLVTAGNDAQSNTMTASWGGLGILWGKPMATCYIRPQRYTKEFLDKEDYFTLAFFGEEWRKQLGVCGSKSGRTVDKVKECGFTVQSADCGAPYFAEADLVLVCRKRFVQKMEEANIPDDVKEQFYPEQDYHFMYLGEIIEVLSK